MKELKKYMYCLDDEDFGKLVKCYFYYMEFHDIPEDLDNKTEQLFRTTIKRRCDYQIKDTINKRKAKEKKNYEKC